MATLHRPIARWPPSISAWVTIPTGLVKSTIQAPGAARRPVSSASSSTSGTVRSALARPPAPVVSWPTTPKVGGSVSSVSRAAWPPTRSWMSTKSAPSIAASRSPLRTSRPPQPSRSSIRRARPPTIGQPLRVDVEQDQLVDRQALVPTGEPLDELRRIGAAAADDGDLDAHSVPSRLRGLDTNAYNVISNSRMRKTPEPPNSFPRSHPPMARYRLELGPIPLHHQVYLDLKAALDAGEWAAGDRLPTERDLASRYGCSLITIRRALSELVRESRLERTRGRGTFVLAPRIDVDFAGALSFTEEMQTRGLDPQTRLVAARPEAAGEAVGDGARPGAGIADALPRTAAPGRWRAAAARAGPPAGRAIPGSARHGSRGWFVVRPA